MRNAVNLLGLRAVQIVLYVSTFEETPQARSFVYVTRKMMLETFVGFLMETAVMRMLYVDYGLDFEGRRLGNESSQGKLPSRGKSVVYAKVLVKQAD